MVSIPLMEHVAHAPMPDAAAVSDRPRTVLLVDDSRAQRSLLSATLSRWEYDVLEAADGEEALSLIRDRDVDIVLSDWMMPMLSGPDLCRHLRREEDAGRRHYFVLMTAQTEREAVAQGLESGADDFLAKPVHPEELRARLRAGERILASQRAITVRNRMLSRALGEVTQLNEAIAKDLAEARKLQDALMPVRDLSLSSTDVTLLFRPSGQIGGDLVGQFPAGPDRLGVFSVDVAGHGIASALLTARIAGVLTGSSPERNLALTGEAGAVTMRPVEEICARLNAHLLEDTASHHYLTMLIADCDLATGRCVLAQAGHPSPMVQRAEGGLEFPSSFGMPIGLIEGAEYSSFEVALGPGDRLMLYTDGITECAAPGGLQLEEAGLRMIVDEIGDRRGRAFTDALVDRLIAYQGKEAFDDDLSAALIERH